MFISETLTPRQQSDVNAIVSAYLTGLGLSSVYAALAGANFVGQITAPSIAGNVYVGGVSGPQLDMGVGGTIRARTNNGLADAPISASQFNWLALDTVSSRGRMMHSAAVGVDLQANEATNPLFRVTYAGTEYPLSVSRSGVILSQVGGPSIFDGAIGFDYVGYGMIGFKKFRDSISNPWVAAAGGGTGGGSSAGFQVSSEGGYWFTDIANAVTGLSRTSITQQANGTLRIGSGNTPNANGNLSCAGINANYVAINPGMMLYTDNIRTNAGGTSVAFRNNNGSADVGITCGNVTSSGFIDSTSYRINGSQIFAQYTHAGRPGAHLDVGGAGGYNTIRLGGTFLNANTLIAIGGTDVNFPAIRRNGAGIDLVTASESGYVPLNAGIATLNRSTAASYGVYAQGRNASGYVDWELNEGLIAGTYGGSLTLRAGDAANTGNVRLEYSQGYPKLSTNQTSFTFSGTGFQTRYTNGYIDFSILNQTYLTLGTPAGALINSRATSQRGLVVQSVAGATAPVIETQDSTGAATLRFHPNMSPSSEATDPYMLDIKSQVNWNTPSSPFMTGGLFCIRNSTGAKMIDIYKSGGSGGSINFRVADATGSTYLEFSTAGGVASLNRSGTNLFRAGGSNVINFESGASVGTFDQNLDATLTVTNFNSASRRGLLIKGMASQTGNLIETRDSSNSVLPFAVSSSGAARFGFFSLTADPSTLDLAVGGVALYKNTTSGVLKLWANDGGTMKSVALV